MRALVLDKASWKKHIMLDKLTGLDPQGIKLRAAQGFDATDLYVKYKVLNPAILISYELHHGILDMEQNLGKSCNHRIRPVGHLCSDSPNPSLQLEEQMHSQPPTTGACLAKSLKSEMLISHD